VNRSGLSQDVANIPLQIDPALWQASTAFEGLEGLESYLASTNATPSALASTSTVPPVPVSLRGHFT